MNDKLLTKEICVDCGRYCYGDCDTAEGIEEILLDVANHRLGVTTATGLIMFLIGLLKDLKEIHVAEGATQEANKLFGIAISGTSGEVFRDRKPLRFTNIGEALAWIHSSDEELGTFFPFAVTEGQLRTLKLKGDNENK